ncbi:MAG TPA: AMP-binding protein [Candidatus Limnocylindrales bacterium]|nr:AMP-binding protein [Candidatus Limnocylindrales bacterium]
METLLDLLDEAVAKYADRPALGVRRDDGTIESWSYRELDHRSRAAAFRLRALGLEPGDRILTWAPSTPSLAAVYFGAIRARLILVPLDLQMSIDAIAGIVRKAAPRRLILGTGRDAPDPAEASLEAFPTSLVEAIAAPPDDALPADWEAHLEALPRPRPDELWELVFTSGTTGTPKGVMLAHDNIVASIRSFYLIIPRLEHRLLSIPPLSHLLGQAVALFYALSLGADILYPRSINPRILFDAMRTHRVTSMVVVPQVLDLFWSGIEREVDKTGRRRQFDLLRRVARPLPLGTRRFLFRSVHRQLGGELRLFVSAGAFLPPAVQQAWEDLGCIVLQGYGASETGTGACTTLEDHGLGTVGRPPAGVEMRIAEDGEIQFKGAMLFKGYWDEPAKTAEAFTEDGWYRSGDIGHLDPEGRLILSGRVKDMIALPNGFKVYPEDIENALRIEGIRDSVVIETRPGRIEAIVLAPGVHGMPQSGRELGFDAATPPESIRSTIDAAVKAANARLGPNQRMAGWRLWPEADFPRTHTYKVKRDQVRAWARVDTPITVR